MLTDSHFTQPIAHTGGEIAAGSEKEKRYLLDKIMIEYFRNSNALF
jgi:hypothetical protein